MEAKTHLFDFLPNALRFSDSRHSYLRFQVAADLKDSASAGGELACEDMNEKML